MFFSKVFLVAIFIGAVSVLATPHALQHHALHRRAIAARVAASAREASAPTNGTVGRKNSAKCSQRSVSASSSPVLAVPAEVSEATSQSAPVISSQPPPPSPTSTPSPTPTPSPSPSPTPTPSPSSTLAPSPSTSSPTPSPSPTQQEPSTDTSLPYPGNHSGQGTFFDTGLGACGDTNVDTDFICAVSEELFDTYPGYDGVNPNKNPVCGRLIQVNYQGKSVTVKAVDRCTGCAMYDIDMTPSAFQSLAGLGLGRIDITWDFL